MNRLIFCFLMLTLVIGCKKSKQTPAPPTPEPATTPTVKQPKSNYLANVLKPRAVAKSGRAAALDRVLVSADGTRLVLGLDEAKRTQIWDIRGEPKKLAEHKGTARALSPDGSLYLRVSESKPEIVKAESEEVVCTVEVLCIEFHFRSPDVLVGARLSEGDVSKPKDLIVREFDTATGKEKTNLRVPSFEIGASHVRLDAKAGDELVVVNTKSRSAEWWSVVNQKQIRSYTLLPHRKDADLSMFEPSHDAKWLSVRTAAGAEILDATSGAPVTAAPKNAIIVRFIPRRDLIAAKLIFNDDHFRRV